MAPGSRGSGARSLAQNVRLGGLISGEDCLDVLYTAQTSEHHGSPHYVIYERPDVTEFVKAGAR